MSLADRIEEMLLAPVGCMLMAPDTRVIERDGWYQVITPSSGSVLGNEVALSRVAARDAEATVRETIAMYATAGVPFRWCVGGLSEPSDLGATLEAHGFTFSEGRGMAISPDAWTAARPDDVAVELSTPDTIDEYLGAFGAGWGRDLPPSRPSWRDDHLRALATGRFYMFVARRGGAIAGSAGFVTKSRSAYLVGGNVLPEHRGRGVYRALLDERLRRIAGLGLPLATTQAREATSAPILEHLGFETLCRLRMYLWRPQQA